MVSDKSMKSKRSRFSLKLSRIDTFGLTAELR